METTATDALAGEAPAVVGPSRAVQAARALVGGSVDAASLAAFRVIFGTTMFVSVVRFIQHGWVDEYFVRPTHFFSYWGLDWIRPLPAPLMHALFVAMGVAALGIAVGLFYRACAGVFFAFFTYAHLIDKTNYLNHYYLISLVSFLLVLVPLGSVHSLDARRNGTHRDTAPKWCVVLLRFQIGLVYFFGGIAKLESDWLVRARPLGIWLYAHRDLPLVGPLLRREATAYAMSYAGAAFDLCVVPLLLWKRTRPFAFAVLVLFHVVTARLFPIGMFPWIMIGAALIFFSPSWPRRVFARIRDLLGRTPRGAAVEDLATSQGSAESNASIDREPPIAALVVYAAIQLIVPLRHLAYPGNVLWTEQGFRFSWMVMLMEKTGVVEVTATDPSTGRSWEVHPREFLTAYQINMMSTQPDMVAQFAGMVAKDFQARGVSNVEVRVRADVSLNGRPAEALVDPAVDLARESAGWLPARWITSGPPH